MSNVLTVVFDKAEQKLDSVIAAAVNELHNLGHVVKEVRVMGDSGEAKVALNTIEGIVNAPEASPAAAPPPETTAAIPPVTDTVENKAPDGSSPVVHAGTVEGAPVDTPPAPADVTAAAPTIDQKREALLAQLEELDKQEEADAAGSVDPTNSAGGTQTPATA